MTNATTTRPFAVGDWVITRKYEYPPEYVPRMDECDDKPGIIKSLSYSQGVAGADVNGWWWPLYALTHANPEPVYKYGDQVEGYYGDMDVTYTGRFIGWKMDGKTAIIETKSGTICMLTKHIRPIPVDAREVCSDQCHKVLQSAGTAYELHTKLMQHIDHYLATMFTEEQVREAINYARTTRDTTYNEILKLVKPTP